MCSDIATSAILTCARGAVMRSGRTFVGVMALVAVAVAFVGDRHRQGGAEARPAQHPAEAQPASAYGHLPLSFEPNRGQSDARVRFIAHAGGVTVFLTRNQAS